jgi:hypothetical protein
LRSRRLLPARRTASVILKVFPVPGGELPADSRLYRMDSAQRFSVLGSPEEWALPHGLSIQVLPVIYPDYAVKVMLLDLGPAGFPPVREAYCDMPEDILSVLCNPGDDVLDNPLLVPPPAFAAYSALNAVLFSGQWETSRMNLLVEITFIRNFYDSYSAPEPSILRERVSVYSP